MSDDNTFKSRYGEDLFIPDLNSSGAERLKALADDYTGTLERLAAENEELGQKNERLAKAVWDLKKELHDVVVMNQELFSALGRVRRELDKAPNPSIRPGEGWLAALAQRPGESTNTDSSEEK